MSVSQELRTWWIACPTLKDPTDVNRKVQALKVKR